MENTEQEPEEIPMEEVLAEIRHILSAEVKIEKNNETEKIEPVLTSPRIVQEIPKLKPQQNLSQGNEIFILTPAMRCDIPTSKALSQNVQKQTQKVLDKLQKGNTQTDNLSPELIAWLNKNLPDLIEKTVKERFS